MMRGMALLFVAPLFTAAQTVPVYQVTVVERNPRAVNYQYRAGPTEIDFAGTVLLPAAKGHAKVESHRGRIEVEANFKKLAPPTPFGQEYLTYVLWAISPEGAPHNLCEIVPNGSDDAKVHVSTELQTFAMIVTAEPYSAVRQPSDVVVMENQVRPDTIGKMESVEAKAELLPRGHYTLDKGANAPDLKDAPKVSMGEYEQISQIYQAQNAIAMARNAQADTLAGETLAKAQRLLDEAKQQRAAKAGTTFVVQTARAAAQTADDARVLAQKRGEEQKLLAAQQSKMQAETEAQRARAEADASRAQVEDERAARLRAEARAVLPPVREMPHTPPPPPAVVVTRPAVEQPNSQVAQLRMSLANRLNTMLTTRDTPRGLVVTIPDNKFEGSALRPDAAAAMERLAVILATPGLRLSIEGYTDNSATTAVSSARAEAVRDALNGHSLAMTAQGFGAARPVTSNGTEAGRMENRRVEVVVTGSPIGDSPVWNRGYTLPVR